MKQLKMLGFAMLVAAALASFTGSASATTLTSPAGTTLGAGAKIKLSGSFELKGVFPVAITCLGSKLEGEVEQAGGPSETVRIAISPSTFTECGNHTVSFFKGGVLEVHTRTGSADGYGSVRWRGLRMTAVLHSVFGSFHCIYGIENGYVGTINGSTITKSTATFGASFLEGTFQEATDSICGTVAQIGGSWKIETPDYLDVD